MKRITYGLRIKVGDRSVRQHLLKVTVTWETNLLGDNIITEEIYISLGYHNTPTRSHAIMAGVWPELGPRWDLFCRPAPPGWRHLGSESDWRLSPAPRAVGGRMSSCSASASSAGRSRHARPRRNWVRGLQSSQISLCRALTWAGKLTRLVRAEWKFKRRKSDRSSGNKQRVGIVEHCNNTCNLIED